MKKIIDYTVIILIIGSVMILSILAPSILSKFTDAKILNTVNTEENDALSGGYRYKLSPNERLYILSNALNSRTPRLSNYAASIREKMLIDNESLLESYTYIMNYRGPAENELTKEEVIEACNRELALLSDLGIIPFCKFIYDDNYEVNLYSAADMLEPGKSVSVWQITCLGYSGRCSLIEAYIDAETGKIYSFSLRSEQTNENFEADKIIDVWCEYLQLGVPEAVTEDDSLMERTPHYKKYFINGTGDNKTIVTAGFYSGVNEFFIRITE